ncbi:MAG: hypothetical protein ACI837_002894 [Crocinitomicaceae bacterium]|jgi:hypothetical protein
MKRINLLLGGLLIGVSVMSCKKAEVIPTPIYEGTEAQTISDVMNTYLEDQAQNFTVDANVATEVQGNQGTRIILSGNNFTDAGGNPLTGMVDIELIEIYKQSAMILANKVTVADVGGTNETISSGGEFRITITQGGMPVTIANELTVVTALATLGLGNMELFGGTLDVDGDIIWNAVDTVTVILDFPVTQGWYAFLFDGSYSWVNCDYFWLATGPKTSVTIHVPAICDENNSRLYMAFASENAVAGLTFNELSGNFETGLYYSLPEGLTPYFVLVVEDSGQLKYSIHQSTIVTNHDETITTLTDVGSMAELEVILDAIL